MNLYRSFGNMLETWVTEDYPVLDLQGPPGSEVSVDEEVEEPEGVEVVVPSSQACAFRSGSRDSLRFSGVTARSESEDSGVELLSASSTWKAQQLAMAVMALEASGAGESEGLEGDQKVTSGSVDDHHPCLPTCPSSPALSSRSCPSSPSSTSSSSSCQSVGSSLLPVGTIGSPSGLRVEQMLRRTDLTRRQVPRRGFSLATRGALTTQPRKRSNTTTSTTTCSSTGAQASRVERLTNFELGEEQTLSFLPQTTAVQAEGERLQTDPATQLSNRIQAQQSETPSTPLTSRLQAQASGTKEVGWAELSPGFLYLEQMCRMLEKLAQLKMGHHGLQTEIEQLRNQQNHRRTNSTQFSTSSQSSSSRSAESLSQILENRINQVDEETLSEGQDILGELRCRSVSDVGRLTPHPYHRVRSRSIGDLLEEDEEETVTYKTDASESQQQQQSESVRPGSTGTWGLRQKIASLHRNEARPDLSDGRSYTLPRLGKKPSLKGLTQLFKKRSKSST